MNRVQVVFFWSKALLMLLALAGPARATLGEPADSVAKDSKALAAVLRKSTPGTGYTVQELLSSATVIREYIDDAGIVFAVAWVGRKHPDFSQLLGSYAEEFRTARRKIPRKHGKKSLRVEAGQVTVETWGHMGQLQGRAYLPSLVPSGVGVDEIK